jgi:predicted DNA-binding transcriptional regulator AlpA
MEVVMTTDELVADGIVTLDYAMRFLSVSRPTLNKLIERGDLPTVVLVDKRRSIPKRALLDFAAGRVQTVSD